eukprot:sb/3464153/
MAAAVIKLTSALRMQDDFSDESTFSTRPLQTLLTIDSYLSCRDPFETALLVRKSIVEVLNIRFEFTTDLAKLIKEGDQFTYDLLNCCNVMSEARIILSSGSSKILSQAADRNNKLFVSHPFSQQVIREAWRKNLVYNRSTFQLAMRALVFPFFLPFFLLYLPFERKSILETWFGRCLKFLMTPMLCYIIDSVNYFIFLATVIYTTLNGIDYIIYGDFRMYDLVCVFALSRMVIDVDQLFHEGLKQFRSQFWNLLEAVLNIVFFISYIFYRIALIDIPATADGADGGECVPPELTTTRSTSNETNEDQGMASDFILISSYLFAFAEFFLVFRALNYLEVVSSKNLGPLIISIKYLLGDVFRFVMIVMFTCAVSAAGAIFTIISTVSNKKMMGDKCRARPTRFNDPYTSFVTIVWSTFGIFEYDNLTIEDDDASDFCTKMIMLLYLVFSIIIMLNILIAMLNTTYERIQENSDLESKFLQSQLLKVPGGGGYGN